MTTATAINDRIDRYIQKLQLELEGKDLGQVRHRQAGEVLLLLRVGDDELRCVVLSVHDAGVSVGEGPLEAMPRTTIRARAEDWMQFTSDPTSESLRRLELYGDPSMLTVVSELLSQRRSPISARFMVQQR